MNNKKNNISEQNIFVLGLDPVFLDIILTPFDENNKKQNGISVKTRIKNLKISS